MTLSAGSLCLSEFSVKLMMVLFIVSRIMLAKPIIMVVIIAKEIKPPVNVLYSDSYLYLNI
jgi:hypothetical protein